MFYEYHNYPDDKLKIIYHKNTKRSCTEPLSLHFHENIELLLFLEGSATVRSDNELFSVEPGDIAVIAPNHLHTIIPSGISCRYHCLIIDKNIYGRLFEDCSYSYINKTSDPRTNEIYLKVFECLEQKMPFYRQEAASLLCLLITLILRQGENSVIVKEPGASVKKSNIASSAIKYMYEHFSEKISIDDICKASGFSKYYFCRCFKEATGQTPLWHLNYIRCRSARSMLIDGKYNVTETGNKCGFSDSSYFCKTYKKYFGRTPHEDYMYTGKISGADSAIPNTEYF